MLTVNTNLASLSATRNLQRTNRHVQASMQRISSGLRITRAADDPAGLAVAENLDAQTRSLRQAKRNVNDGVSFIQTFEGSANETANVLKRFRELLVEGSSETLNSTERSYIVTELGELKSEMARIAGVTEFNGITLAGLLGSGSKVNVQVGAHNTVNDRITIDIGNMYPTAGLSIPSIGGMMSAVGMQNNISNIDTALDRVNMSRAKYGAVQNRLESALNSLETYTENMESAESRIRDADFARETAELAKYQIIQQAGIAILAQANQINQGALRLLG